MPELKSIKKILFVVLVIGFIISAFANLIVGIQFPIYTDDVGFLILGSRYFQDGLIRPSLFAECPNNGLGTPIPWSIIPGLIINSLYFGWISSPFELRVFSILQFIAWLLILAKIRKLVEPEETSYSRLTYLFLPLCGTIPITLTMARPEQTIAIILSLVLLFSISKSQNLFFKTLYLIFPTWLIALHPKSFFFLPLLGFSAFKKFSSTASKIFYFSWLSIIFVQGYFFYSKVLSCNENPKIGQTLSTINKLLSPKDILTDPGKFISQGSVNIVKQISGLFYYIPSWKDWTGNLVFFDTTFLLPKITYTLILILIFYIPFQVVIRRISGQINYSEKLSYLYLITASEFAYFFFQNWHYFYYAAFSFFLVFTAAILVLPKIEIKKSPLHILLITNLIANTFVCVLWLCSNNLMNLTERWEKLMSEPFTRYFNSSFQSKSENQEIRKALNSCGITDITNSRLIIDEATYFALKDSKLPVMSQYTWEAFRDDLPDVNFPKSLGYSAVITRCKRLPNSVRNETTEFGKYCCKAF